jgi:CheY-like chemotaxis protein
LPPEGNPWIVFVVDDEEMISSTLGLILRGRGYDARSFVDPVEALKASQSASPDLLLTDVMMPQMNGIDLAIQVTQLNPTSRVLLFSGQAATQDLLPRANSEGYHFNLLSKPVPPKTLIDKIRELFHD